MSTRSQGRLLALAAGLSALVALALAVGEIAGRARDADGIAPAVSQASTPVHVRGRLVGAVAAELDPVDADSARALPAALRAAPATPTVEARDDGFGTCSVAGRITQGGAGVIARLRIAIERDQWREVETNESGSFECTGLRAGRHLVAIEVHGLASCTRTIALRPHRVERLEVDFARIEPVNGHVLGPDGTAIAGAEVSLDGQRDTTGLDGQFALVRHASGTAELVVRAPGWAWFTCAVRPDERAPLAIELEPACALEVVLPESLRDQDVAVHVAPGDVERTAGSPVRPATPWHLLSPVRSARQDAVVFENLPAGDVDVWVVGADSIARSQPLRTSADQRARAEPRELATTTARGSALAALWRSQAATGPLR